MKIEHIALYVQDLEQARNFFCKYFGAKSNEGYYNPNTGLRSYFLSFQDGARLEIMTKPELTAPGDKKSRFGYAHLAFSVGSREEVDRLTELLQHDGYPVISGPRITGDGYYESCILDAEGNILEITV